MTISFHKSYEVSDHIRTFFWKLDLGHRTYFCVCLHLDAVSEQLLVCSVCHGQGQMRWSLWRFVFLAEQMSSVLRISFCSWDPSQLDSERSYGGRPLCWPLPWPSDSKTFSALSAKYWCVRIFVDRCRRASARVCDVHCQWFTQGRNMNLYKDSRDLNSRLVPGCQRFTIDFQFVNWYCFGQKKVNFLCKCTILKCWHALTFKTLICKPVTT